MASGSVTMELDIVEIYKKKINTNSQLKKKRLNIINTLFIVSLVCFMLFACVSSFFFKSFSNFKFHDEYALLINNYNLVFGKVFSQLYMFSFYNNFLSDGGIELRRFSQS